MLEAEQPLTSYFSRSDSGPTFPAFDISHLRRRGWEHRATVVPQILFSQIFTQSWQIFFTLICSYLSTTNISESGMFAVLNNIFTTNVFSSGICAMLAKLDISHLQKKHHKHSQSGWEHHKYCSVRYLHSAGKRWHLQCTLNPQERAFTWL